MLKMLVVLYNNQEEKKEITKVIVGVDGCDCEEIKALDFSKVKEDSDLLDKLMEVEGVIYHPLVKDRKQNRLSDWICDDCELWVYQEK